MTVVPAPPPDALEWAEATVQAVGGTPESPRYLATVAAWREAWRPPRVRTLLVAESHVQELPGDADARVVSVPGFPRVGHPLPRHYCRLVYCLGYGESTLCDPAPNRNTGTWQYWDILGQVARGIGCTQPRKASRDTGGRLSWKLDTLRALQAAGVWLVDASIIALYSPGGRRLFAGGRYERTLRESWSRFVWPSVAPEPLEQIWVIGRGVGSALKDMPELRGARVISQPRDRNVVRYKTELATLVREVRRI
jgi:hypothetical protein